MSADRNQPHPSEPFSDEVIERSVGRCIELGDELDDASLAHACEGDADLVDVVRGRLKSLANFGLLPAMAPTGPEFRDYELLEELGSGGMGVVWLARRRSDGERVALKTADPRVPWTPRMRERFRREVHAASVLSHPNIVAIHDFGEEGGLPYYTMEHVEGATLADLLLALSQDVSGPAELRAESLLTTWRAACEARGSVPAGWPERWGTSFVHAACSIVLDVADALAHAHEHGVVHRDVKPANVLVDHEGRARLFDLGLAHLADQPALTLTADFAGSPHYASPEQISGSARLLDGRTDIYSLGVTLYETFALRPPFRAANTPQLLRAIQQSEPPALRSLAPLVPRDLETICHTCLEKRPEHRYATAGDLARDLRGLLRFEPIVARPPGVARRTLRRARRNPTLAVAIGLGASVLLAAPLALWRHEVRLRTERDRANTAAAEAQREASEHRQVSAFLESLLRYLDESGEPHQRRAAQDLIGLAIERADGTLQTDNTTRASLLTTVADVLIGMNRPAESIPLLDRAFSIRTRGLGEHHTATAEVLQRLASSHEALGQREQARALAQRCLDALTGTEATPETREMRADVSVMLARLMRGEGELAPARALLEEAEGLHTALGTEHTAGFAALAQERGECELVLSEEPQFAPERAQRAFEQSRDTLRSLPTPPLGQLARALDGLARTALALNDFEGARDHWREALGLQRKRAGDRSTDLIAVLRNLAEVEAQIAALGGPALKDPARGQHLMLLARNVVPQDAPEAEELLAAACDVLRGIPGSETLLGECLVDRADLRLARSDDATAAQWIAEASELVREPPEAEWELRCLQRLLELEARGITQAPLGTREQVTALLLSTVLGTGAPSDLPSASVALIERHARYLESAGDWRAATRLLLRLTEDANRAGELRSERADPFQVASQAGVTALQAGRFDEAALAFRQCLELHPQDGVAAYNLACALALGGARPAALDALERASDNGFGYRADAIRTTLEDADLASLRADTRFQAIVSEMRERVERADAYAFEPAFYLPPSIADAPRVPVLLVLHANGGTKEAISRGPWRTVAEELGYALLVPAGRIPVGAHPSHGTRWAEDFDDYGTRSAFYEEPIRAAFAHLRDVRGLEPESVLVAGSGLGGTLAFNTALRSPELVRGAILVDAPLHEGLAAEKAPHLGSMGFRATLLASVGDSPTRDEDVQASLRAADTFRRLRDWGIRSSFGTWPVGVDARDPVDVLRRAVKWVEGG